MSLQASPVNVAEASVISVEAVNGPGMIVAVLTMLVALFGVLVQLPLMPSAVQAPPLVH